MAPPAVAVIPARYDSTRFPGKPLADVLGVPMIVRVARQAASAARVDRVIVATDDARIAEVVEAHGFSVAMTPADCPSGSDRVAHAIRGLGGAPGLVVNVQGDEPLVDPRDIDRLVAAGLAHPEAICTLGRPADLAEVASPHVVKAVVAPGGRALYFSRAPIPHGEGPHVQHVGLYAYAPDVLARFTALTPTPLERRERLEQLRALENGIPIHLEMCVSDRPSVGVDVPADLDRVRAILTRQGTGKQEHGS